MSGRSIRRAAVVAAQRVVVKVGSSSLASTAQGLDADRVQALADAIAVTHRSGRQVVVVSSGAIAAGLAPLGLSRRPQDLAGQQAAAAVGQSLLVASWSAAFAKHGLTVAQVLLTSDDVVRRAHYRNASQTLERLLELGVVPIVNENDTVATAEIRFGDNDRLAALVAHVVRAQLLILLSDVAGLYDRNPRDPGAVLLAQVNDLDDLSGVRIGPSSGGVGTGGMITKIEAARIATGGGVPVVLTSATAAGLALSAEAVGTYFPASPRRRSARLLWLEHASEPQGRLHLDAGAVRAVVDSRRSLLAAGVKALDGAFVSGDPVDLVAPDGTVVARGLVAYDADELPLLLGRSSRASQDVRAPWREVVHRDDLVVLPS